MVKIVLIHADDVIEEAEKLALSGSGILYVSFEDDSTQKSVSVIDKGDGRVLRTLDTSKADSTAVWILQTHQNLFLIVEYDYEVRHKCVHMYNNEVYKRTLQLDIPLRSYQTSTNYISTTILCGGNHLLLHKAENEVAAVNLNQNIEAPATFKTIQLNQMDDIHNLVWVPRDNEETGKGYLLASEYLYDRFNSRIYELDLHAIPTTLTPLQIPFMNSYGCKNVAFKSTMGKGAILCYDACGKDTGQAPQVNILRLEKINE